MMFFDPVMVSFDAVMPFVMMIYLRIYNLEAKCR